MSAEDKSLQSTTGTDGGGLASTLLEAILAVDFLGTTTRSQKSKHDTRSASGMSRATRELLGRRASDAARDRQVFLYFPPHVKQTSPVSHTPCTSLPLARSAHACSPHPSGSHQTRAIMSPVCGPRKVLTQRNPPAPLPAHPGLHHLALLEAMSYAWSLPCMLRPLCLSSHKLGIRPSQIPPHLTTHQQNCTTAQRMAWARRAPVPPNVRCAPAPPTSEH